MCLLLRILFVVLLEALQLFQLLAMLLFSVPQLAVVVADLFDRHDCMTTSLVDFVGQQGPPLVSQLFFLLVFDFD
jgi:hypothetical protein